MILSANVILGQGSPFAAHLQWLSPSAASTVKCIHDAAELRHYAEPVPPGDRGGRIVAGRRVRRRPSGDAGDGEDRQGRDPHHDLSRGRSGRMLPGSVGFSFEVTEGQDRYAADLGEHAALRYGRVGVTCPQQRIRSRNRPPRLAAGGAGTQNPPISNCDLHHAHAAISPVQRLMCDKVAWMARSQCFYGLANFWTKPSLRFNG